MRRVLVLSAVVLAGCFPDYETEPDDHMVIVHSAGQSVDFEVAADTGLTSNTVSFTYDFDIDQYEVTVGRFNEWWKHGRKSPDPDSSLDPDGAYKEQMSWEASWNDSVSHEYFDWAAVDTDGKCSGPEPYPLGEAPSTTWRLAEDGVAGAVNFPMTCVSWMQAAAFCASEGKRLPTAAEWSFVRTDGVAPQLFPWGNAEPPGGCDGAVLKFNGGFCGFPRPIGSSNLDHTADGVEDLVGSVFEWVWDVQWEGNKNEPNWAAPSDGADASARRLRGGGSYITDVDEERTQGRLEPYGAGDRYNDAGFRCVRSVR